MPKSSTTLAIGAVAAMLTLLGGDPAGAFADRAQGASAPAARPATAPSTPPRPAPVKPVDINSATKDELKTLPGVGDAEAQRIIAARPYPSKAKLLADKVISAELYAALKGRIVAEQKEVPKAKPGAKPAGKS